MDDNRSKILAFYIPFISWGFKIGHTSSFPTLDAFQNHDGTGDNRVITTMLRSLTINISHPWNLHRMKFINMLDLRSEITEYNSGDSLCIFSVTSDKTIFH